MIYTQAVEKITVTVIAGADAFDEEVKLVVKPLDAASDAYKDAEAALAAEGKTYDGMMAFDIGFVSTATGAEVEPASPVTVKMMVNKAALTGLNVNTVDTDSMTVTHITEDAVVDVADAADETDGQVTVFASEEEMKSIKAEFEVDGFSTYTITWTEDGDEKSATIHWGSYNATGEFEEFNSTTTVDATASSVDLNVNVDGYYFVGVDYLPNGAEEPTHLEQTSVLKKDGDTYKIGDTVIADGSDVYVNYASKGDGSYTPPPKPAADVLAPETDKTVTDNGDGTYTIQLDIEGKQDQHVTQVGANVIIIMDITQSMTNNMPGGGGTRMAAAKRALNTLIDTLDPSTNLINFTAVNFGNSANYSNGVNWTTTESQMRSYVTGLPNNPSDLGTCWQAGLQGGIDRVGTAPAGNETYVLFVTDGNPNGWVNAQGRYQQQGAGGFVQAAYNAAVPNANALAGISHLYGIFCGDADGYDHLEDLITNANGEDVINGNTTDAIEQAFAQIAQTIVDNLGAGNTSVDDGIPTLSNVSAAVADGEAGGFEYYITEPGQEMKEWEDAPGASYDKSNGVTWDLGEVGVLPNGTVYTLKFTVWPSQAAYDLIADLNNGLIELSDLTEEQRASIEGDKESGYTLKTNTHLYTTFTDLDGNEYREINDASSKAMNLPTETINIKKIWNNFLDQQNPPAGVKLILTKDGDNYLYGDNAIEVSSNTGWEKKDIYISLGQIKQASDGSYEILESGHDYEIVEPENYDGDYRWELTSEVYHPMVINGTATMLIKDENASGTEGTDYYVIDGTKYKKADGEGNTLKAWNDRRSWLQIEKTVTGTGAPADALFEFTVTINDANEEDIWYSAYGPDGIIKDLETSGTAETDSSGNTGYYYAASGSEITAKIQAGWTLRFLNLPSGTTYTIDETGFPDGFAFAKAEGDTVVDTDADQDDPEAPTVTGSTVEGTINVPNVEFYAKYSNKYEEIDIEFTKEWVDGDNQDGIRPSAEEFAEYLSLLVNETASTAYDSSRTITDNDDGTYTITYTGVPKYIDGEEAKYQLEESEIEGYTTTGSPADVDGTITNTHEPETVDITAEKVWEDEEDHDGMREDVIFDLYAGDTKLDGKSVTIAKDATGDDLKAVWEKLPKFADGEEITYSVKEAGESEGKITMGDVEYDVTYEGDAENGFTITNSYEPAETTVTVTKIWEDNDDQDGLRPESISVQLMAGNEASGDPITLNEENDWTYTWEELAVYAGGEAITYSVEEIDEIDGYDTDMGEMTGTAADGFEVEITNTHELIKTTVTVTKVWEDNNDQDGLRPESISVQLMAGETAQGDPVTLNEENEWTYTWQNLDAYADGEAIAYTVAEPEVSEDYEVTVGDVTGSVEEGWEVEITNEHEAIKTTVKVTKVWEDADDQDGLRPESISVQLMAGETAQGDPVTLNEENEWTYTWEELDAYAGGEAIAYTVAEPEVSEDYEVEVGDVTGSAEEGWEVEITNTHEPIKTTVKVTKVWEDADDQDGLRPESISVQLMAGETAQGDPVTLNEENDWTYTWEELDAYAGGEAIAYTVAEPEVSEDYEVEVGEVTGSIEEGWEVEITNTHEPIKTTVTVTKSWEDEDDHDGMRPESISVQLTADGKASGDPVTLTADGQWTYTWEDLDAYAGGKEIAYSVEELEVENYEVEVAETTGDIENGYVVAITNTHESLKTTVKVTKTWEDEDDKFGKRPESITVQLTLNGEAEGDAVELNADNDWTYTWEDLYAIVDGADAEYGVEESNELPAGYVKEVGEMTGDAENGFEVEITNTFKPEDTDPPVSKEITGGVPAENVTFKFTFEAVSSDPEPPMPELTEVEIDGEGETEFGQFWFTEPGTYEYEIKEVKGDAEGYTYDETVYELKYVIEVGEDNALVKTVFLDGEELDGDVTVDQIKFTNEYVPEEPIEITVTKTWNDDDDEWSIRPSSIKVSLLANGEVVKTAKLTEADGWTYTFKNVEKTDEDGNDIEYTIDEVKVDGYEKAEVGELTEEDEGVYSIELTNTRAEFDPAEDVMTVKKSVQNAPKKASTYEFTLTAVGDAPMPEGVKNGTLTIKGSGSSQIKFSFDEPGTYTYTLKEVNTGEKGCTYDKAEYKLVFKVTADTKNEKLTVKLTVTSGSKSVSGKTVTFTNSYLVPTGDDTNMTPWIVAMATSAAVAGTGAVVLKKRRKEEEDA